MNPVSAEITPSTPVLRLPWRPAMRVSGYLWPLLAVVVALLRSSGALTWEHGVILLTATGQLILYYWLLNADKTDKSETRARLIVYLLGASGLWLVQTALDPPLAWFSLGLILLMFVHLSTGWALLWSSLLFTVTAALLSGTATRSPVTPRDLAPFAVVWVGAILLFLLATTSLRLRREQTHHKETARLRHISATRARELERQIEKLQEKQSGAQQVLHRIAPQLSATRVQLELLQRELLPDGVDPKAATEHAVAAQRQLQQTLGILNSVTGAGSGAGLGERTLYEGIDDLCVQFTQRTGVLVELMMAGNWRDLTPAVSDTLWRVVDGALKSLVDAGSAVHRVAVRCTVEPAQARIAVAADHDPLSAESTASATSHSDSLHEARTLIEQLNGTLDQSPRVGGGSHLRAAVPLR